MTDWYVSSAAYAGYTAFQISHAYIIGDLIVPTAPALKAKWVLQCTIAGTSAGSEPTWATANNATTVSGTATFKNVTGQSALFWTAAAGDLPTLVGNRIIAGDRVFISSDHSETQTAATLYTTSSLSSNCVLYLSANRAGSTPPVAADLTTGATFTASNTLILQFSSKSYFYGCSFVNTSGTGGIQIGNTSDVRNSYFKDCQFWLNNTNASAFINLSSTGGTAVTWDNTTVQFGNVVQKITAQNLAVTSLDWINTPNAIAGATLPTSLFSGLTSSPYFAVNARGVDLSAITGTLVSDDANSGSQYLFANCKIASGVTRYSTTGVTSTRNIVELVSCYDGTNIVSETYSPAGAVTTEFSVTLNGGAADNVGVYSHKMVSNANADKLVFPLNGFWMDVNYTTLGSPKTATVEIIGAGSLNNDEIALYLQYEGTAGTSVASFASSFIATPLTTPAAVPTSTATWLNPAAVKQKLQVTFTPQLAGRLRGQVRLGKASTTVYYNPQITIT